MVKEFKLPDIGEGIHEGEIVRWLVKEGDPVAEDQPIAEVMTDKATVEITSPYSGKVKRLCAGEGESVQVGATIIEIDDGSGNGQAEADAASEPAKPEPAAPEPATPEPAPHPSQPSASQPASPPEPPQPTRTVAPPARSRLPEIPVEAPVAETGGPVLASPATRRLARELGVDIRTIRGSGARGRVTRDDVERAARGEAPQPSAPAASAATPTPAPRPSVPSGGGTAEEERVPLRGLRKKIAEHMALSKRTAAHFTYVEEVDVTRLVELRREAKAVAAEQGVKLTYLPFILKAIAAALKKFPMLNASLDEEQGEIVIKRYYNFGIAVDTDNGLIVPVVKGVDRRSVLDLAREIDRVAQDARNGTIHLDDLRGSTFTVTNAGNIGGLLATPVINYPEVAILGVHKIARRPVVRGDKIEIGDVMYLSISIDHRVVDGADGARFMNEVKRTLEDPRLLLLEA